MASVKLTPVTSCFTARFDSQLAQPPPPVDVDEFRASIERINVAIKPTAAYYAAWASLPLSLLLGVVLIAVSLTVNSSRSQDDSALPGRVSEGGTSNLSALFVALGVAAFAGSCVGCCAIGLMRRKWPARFFAAVSKENAEQWGSRVPSVQWRVDAHQHHVLHLTGTRSGCINARTSVLHSYDLHLDVAGGAPIAVIAAPVVALAQPQQLLQASWGQQPQSQLYQPSYGAQSYGQPQYGGYSQQHPMQMAHMALQQYGAHYLQQPMQAQGGISSVPPPHYSNYRPGSQPQPFRAAQYIDNQSNRLLSGSATSDE